MMITLFWMINDDYIMITHGLVVWRYGEAPHAPHHAHLGPGPGNPALEPVARPGKQRGGGVRQLHGGGVHCRGIKLWITKL